MNYFEFWIGRYKAATSDLSLEDHGAYVLLMAHYYSTERPLPSDYVSLYIICSAITSKRREAVRKVADKFFPLDERGERRNANCDEIIESYNRRADSSRNNGKLGGRPKEPRSNPTGNLDNNLDVTSTINNPQSTIHKEERVEIPSQLRGVIDFSETWERWEKARKKKRKPLDNDMRKEQFDFLMQQPDPVAVLKASIRNGWQGLFPIDQKKNNGKQQLTGAELIASAAKGRAHYEAIDEAT